MTTKRQVAAAVAAAGILVVTGLSVSQAMAGQTTQVPPPTAVSPPHPGLGHRPTAAEIAQTGAEVGVLPRASAVPATGAVDPNYRPAQPPTSILTDVQSPPNPNVPTK